MNSRNKTYCILLVVLSLGLLCSCRTEDISGDIDAYFKMDKTDVLTGDTVSFKAVTLGTVARYEWTFEGGTPSVSNLSAPEVQWFDAGNYTVCLTVSNKNGSKSVTRRKVITVDYTKSISADFSVDRATATNEESVQFTNASSGYPTFFLWTLRSDNGYVVTSEEENPSFVLKPGLYTVTLKAYNPVTSDTKIKSGILYVIDKDDVTADFSCKKNLIVEDDELTFTDKSLGEVTEWFWEFPGGTPATSVEACPTIKYETAGAYDVKLTVKNSLTQSTLIKEKCVNVISKSGMVIFLPLDSDLQDVSPNGFTASFLTKGSAANSYSEGHSIYSAGCVYLPGGSKSKCSVLQLPSENWQTIFPQGSDLTISIWIKVKALGTTHTGIFAMGSCPGVLDLGNNQLWSRMQTNGMMRMLAESYQGGSSDIQVENKWADGNWHHFVFIYKAVSGKRNSYMYIDGELQGSALNKDEKKIDTTPFFIGTNMRLTSGAWAPECCLDGFVDDVIIYSRALDATEIVKLSKY